MNLKRGTIILIIFLSLNFVLAEQTSLSPSDASVTVDTSAPIVQIINPQNTTYSSSSQIFVNYSIFDPTLDSIWYSLDSGTNTSISNPFYLSLTEKDYHLVIYANDSFNRMNFSEISFSVEDIDPFCGDGTCDDNEDCSDCEEDCGECPPDDDGGSSGGSSTPTPISASFKLDTEEISLSMSKGEVRTVLLTIENTGTLITGISTEITLSLEEFVSLDYESFTLNIGEAKPLVLEFIVSETSISDLYAGGIIFMGGGLKREVFIALEIESKESLFDVKTTIPNKFSIIEPGEEIAAEIEIIDVGNLGAVDVTIENSIKDGEGNVIVEKKDTRAVDSKLNFVETMQLPQDIKYGKYVFYTTVFYGDKTAIGSDTFEVRKENALYLYLILGLGVIILILLIYILIKKIKNRKPEKKKVKKDKPLKKVSKESSKKKSKKK